MKKEKKKTIKLDVVQGLANDITLVPSQIIDASAISVVGGLINSYEVEIGEELEIETDEMKEE